MENFKLKVFRGRADGFFSLLAEREAFV